MPASHPDCTAAVLDATPDALLVANLGVASWVLMETADRETNFYLRGGMGCTTPTGLGVALAVDDPVTVLDGDGSMVMSLGCLSTIAEYGPATLTIVVWNNREYATTGGQPAADVDFAAAAEACGLRGERVESTSAFADAYQAGVAHDGPALVDCVVDTPDISSPPAYDYAHSYVTDRFHRAVTGGD